MTETRTVTREVVTTDYSGQNSIKRVEAVEVQIIWPNGFNPKRDSYSTCSGWIVTELPEGKQASES